MYALDSREHTALAIAWTETSAGISWNGGTRTRRSERTESRRPRRNGHDEWTRTAIRDTCRDVAGGLSPLPLAALRRQRDRAGSATASKRRGAFGENLRAHGAGHVLLLHRRLPDNTVHRIYDNNAPRDNAVITWAARPVHRSRVPVRQRSPCVPPRTR